MNTQMPTVAEVAAAVEPHVKNLSKNETVNLSLCVAASGSFQVSNGYRKAAFVGLTSARMGSPANNVASRLLANLEAMDTTR